MAEPSVAAGCVLALLELAVSKGASRAALTERARLAPDELEDRDRRVAFSKYVELMRAGQELCGDPALALHFGEELDLADLSIVGLLGGGLETMSEGLALTNRYAPLIVEVDGSGAEDRFILKRRAGEVRIVDTRKNPNDFPELTESTFARIVCAMRRHFGGDRFLRGIHVTHRAPGYRAEYERILRVPVTFESDENALLTDDAWLRQRIDPSSSYVSGILKAHADSLLETLESGRSTRGRVEALMAPALDSGPVTMEAVARAIGVSRQTLFRRLRAEGVTFQRVLDDLRRTMALDYLTAKRLSVKATAHRLGFSEPAAFSRAFKRWTGSSPSAVARAAASGEDRLKPPSAVPCPPARTPRAVGAG